MNKTFITTAVVGLIILVGGVLVFSGNSTNSEPMSDNRSDQTPTATQSTSSETNMGTTTQPATTQDETSQSGTSSVSDDESAQPPSSESAGADSAQATTVRYTSNGFSPESVTISQGETVKFVNETNSDMWVGSDQHPTHTQYAGTSIREHCPDNGDKAFDQCENGEEYSFTFEKTGSWTYHNHSQASDGGTVTVQ